jgi:hypothetical protein
MDLNDVAPPSDPRPTFGVSGATLRLRRAADAFDPVAWRAPSYPRVPLAPANDDPALVRQPTPRWMIVSGGGVVAAVLGALLGSVLAL